GHGLLHQVPRQPRLQRRAEGEHRLVDRGEAVQDRSPRQDARLRRVTSGSLAGTMRPSRRLRALLSLAATTLATTRFTCGPSGPPLPEPSHRCAPLAPPDDGMPAVEIGTGEGEGFVPVAGPLAREYGPQGGSHVTLTLHLFADAGERWEYDLTLLRDEE